MSLVKVPAVASDPVARLSGALDAIAASGLTGVHDMGVSDSGIENYRQIVSSGGMPVRIWAYVSPGSATAERLLREGPWESGRLRVVGIKAMADGALGSRGALLRSDYTDEAGHTGLAVNTESQLTELATRCLAVRAHLAVHAIGDLAVHRTLNAFEAARSAHPEAMDVPLRVEHAQVVHPDDQGRFASLNVVASMQPTHATSDMPWAEDRLGSHRIAWAYAWRTLMEAGAPMAFGSDFPVESVDPGFGLWSATTRQSHATQPPGGWMPEQRLSINEAVTHFTLGSAGAVGDAELGVLEAGRTADLTLWQYSDHAPGFRAVATVVGGDVVWASAPD
jgi:hypothetical protein